MAAFETVVKQLGFLTDRQILAGLEEGYLLEKGSWDQSSFTSCELHASIGERGSHLPRGRKRPHCNKGVHCRSLDQSDSEN